MGYAARLYTQSIEELPTMKASDAVSRKSEQ